MRKVSEAGSTVNARTAGERQNHKLGVFLQSSSLFPTQHPGFEDCFKECNRNTMLNSVPQQKELAHTNIWSPWDLRQVLANWPCAWPCYSMFMLSAVGWQTCSRRASGTWCPLPETLGAGCQCHTGRLDPLSLAVGAEGPGRGTTSPPQLAPAHSLEDLYWAQGLGSDWPSQLLPGTTAAHSGKCSHESPDSLSPGPLGYLVNLQEQREEIVA